LRDCAHPAFVQIGEHDVHAGLRELERERAADSTCRPGYDCHVVSKLFHARYVTGDRPRGEAKA
jgi:hypothetical protein